MKWFGRSSTAKAADKAEPLIHEVYAVGDDDDDDAQGIGMNPNAVNNMASDIGENPSNVSEGLDANIPANRVTSGERQMVMPKHLKKYDEEDSIKVERQQSDAHESYVPITEVNTTSMDHGSHDNPTVVSAISLSTIGASIEREVEEAKNGGYDQPPLEINATKQKTKRKVRVSYFKKMNQSIHQTIKQTLPNAIVDGLAGAYDTLHSFGPKNKGKSLDDVPVTARRFRRDHPDLLLPGNVPRVGFTACFAAIPAWIKFTIVGAVAAASIATVAVQLEETMLGEEFFDWREEQFVDWSEEKSLAFIGNSYFYVNDVPRLMAKISHGQIKHDSVINPSASLGKLLRAGNGMYELWQNEEALTYKYSTEWSGQEEVYDFGSCTVFQLLENYDGDISYMNYNGAYYYEQGANPCFEDKNYMFYLQDRNLKNPQYFDYVVLNDQTARMTDADSRQDSVEALKYAYSPMIKESRAKPLVVDTHAYLIPEEGTNATGYGYDEAEGIPYMQALIYSGVEEYLLALKSNLPSSQAPRVVPVGMSYLVVWEEDYDLWTRLFLNETMPYASPHGSYLFANVLYATAYGHLPRRPSSMDQIKNFFRSARYLPELPSGWAEMGVFPTVEESDFLRLVTRRVVLNGYIPDSFKEARVQVEEDRIYGYQEEFCTRLCEEYAEQEERGDEDVNEEEGNEYANYGGNYNQDWDCECSVEEEAAEGEDADMDEQQNRQ